MMIMRLVFFILLTLFTVIHVATSPLSIPQQGQPTKDVNSMEKVQADDVTNKVKVEIKSWWGSEGSQGGEEEEELVYNVDYHGVSTHPSPTPRHPSASP